MYVCIYIYMNPVTHLTIHSPPPLPGHSPSRRSLNALGDAGATVIAAGLPGLTRLNTLWLHGNGIGGAGGLAVAREAARLPALETLFLRHNFFDSANGMDAEAKAAIRAMLPHVKDGLESL